MGYMDLNTKRPDIGLYPFSPNEINHEVYRLIGGKRSRQIGFVEKASIAYRTIKSK